jgi:hypothetical protein
VPVVGGSRGGRSRWANTKFAVRPLRLRSGSSRVGAPHLTPSDLTGKLDVLRVELPEVRSFRQLSRGQARRDHRLGRQAHGLALWPDEGLPAEEQPGPVGPVRGAVPGFTEGALKREGRAAAGLSHLLTGRVPILRCALPEKNGLRGLGYGRR